MKCKQCGTELSGYYMVQELPWGQGNIYFCETECRDEYLEELICDIKYHSYWEEEGNVQDQWPRD